LKSNYFKIVSAIIYTLIYGLGVFNAVNASSYTYNVIDEDTHTSYLKSVDGSSFVHTQDIENLSHDLSENCNTSKDTFPEQLKSHPEGSESVETAYFKQYAFRHKSIRINYRKHCLFYPFHNFW